MLEMISVLGAGALIVPVDLLQAEEMLNDGLRSAPIHPIEREPPKGKHGPIRAPSPKIAPERPAPAMPMRDPVHHTRQMPFRRGR